MKQEPVMLVYKKDATFTNKRSVSIERLDDESYVCRYTDQSAETGRYEEVSDSTNNIDLVMVRVKEFLKTGVPF